MFFPLRHLTPRLVYVFLGVYNALVDFLRDLHSEGVTSEGEHVVIAVVNEKDIAGQDFFFREYQSALHSISKCIKKRGRG